MKWVVLCEKSGVVRRALRARGVEAFSCDLMPAEDGSPYHLQCDAREAIHADDWGGMVAHPECRFLSASGLHWNTRPGYEWRAAETEKALAFALELWSAPIPRKIMENPRGRLGAALADAEARYCVQPYQFGDDASKETWFYVRGVRLLPLNPAKRLSGRLVVDPRSGRIVERWSNQTDSGQNVLGPSEDRSAKRAETYPGIAAWVADSIVREVLFA